MIPRYNTPEIEKIWTLENKFKIWTEIEILIAENLANIGVIPKIAAREIRKKARFNVNEINKLEKKTRHDVNAYIDNVSKYIGKYSKYFHHGVTSSDIIDTAFSIQLNQTGEIIHKELSIVLKNLKSKSFKYKNTIMIGRSHGIHAEPITFGLKLASFFNEFKRNLKRLEIAIEEISICSISGPVGTYESIDPRVENYVAKKLKLKCENVSTQIIPRDRHAFFFSVIGIIASSIERFAVEIRHLQRSELLEVEEKFDLKQKGSSAMPHKRNPVLSENLTGLARYIRSAVIPSMENIVLWHERDISHSSVERIMAPDITIALHFSLKRLNEIITTMKVYPDNMKKNLNLLGGLHNSQKLLLKLTKKGLSRQIAYSIVQKNAMEAWDNKVNFCDVLKKDSKILKYISISELNKIFKENTRNKKIDWIFKNKIK
ncbi:MAG: adenylosuccinate lyase [Candidatus Marinimicrobia bacterium]|nr:adenylosuccinate lyase [Candidatus Neomarinimicrobiota bacterium]|tara:strand:+ start:4823 stop:6115 length:1293 start_codon:yes stop_codon:yes gene_type:complete